MRSGPLQQAGASAVLAGVPGGRRRLLQAVPAAVLLAALPHRRAAAAVDELVVACDTTLGPAMRVLGNAYGNVTGVRVNVFPTGPNLILPQLERDVQNDIVVTQTATLTAAVAAGIVMPGGIRGGWRDALAIVARRDAPAAPDKPIAACDPSPASDMDGLAILGRLGLLPTNVIGVIDTDTVAALVLNGTARAGLVHMTDVHAHPDLQVIREVSDDVEPPITVAAAITTLASRPNPQGFIDFLLSGQATSMLAALGLETPSS